jgi:5-methylcytosine-specific restriction endonuclease McrA
MLSNCKNCNIEFKYYPSNSDGIYCSNRCQQDYNIKTQFVLGSKWKHPMGKFLKRLRGNTCEICGISSWNGMELIMQIDHKNGIRTDNRMENLKICCPNCHSQTDTYASKNVGLEGKDKMKKSAENTRNKKKGPLAQ